MKNPKLSYHFQHESSEGTIISNHQKGIDLANEKLRLDLVQLNRYVLEHPIWESSFSPISSICSKKNTEMKFDESVMYVMEQASEVCDVGPMAAVAGALADRMKEQMLKDNNTEIAVVENGGEIIIQSREEIIIGLLVLSTSLQSKIGFKYPGDWSEMAVATSSAKFGHATSLGEADAVVVFAKSAAIADAAATAICNVVKGDFPQQAIECGLEYYSEISSLEGVFIVKDKLVGKKGNLPPLVKIQDDQNYIYKKKIKQMYDL